MKRRKNGGRENIEREGKTPAKEGQKFESTHSKKPKHHKGSSQLRQCWIKHLIMFGKV